MKTKIFINDMEIMNVKKIGKYIYAIFLSVLIFSSCSTPEDRIISYRIEDLPLDSVPTEIWFPESFAVNTNHMVSMQDMLCLVRPSDDASVYFIDEKTGNENLVKKKIRNIFVHSFKF